MDQLQFNYFNQIRTHILYTLPALRLPSYFFLSKLEICVFPFSRYCPKIYHIKGKHCIHSLNMTSKAKIMTILDPNLRLKYDRYVNIQKINRTIHIYEIN